MSTHNKADCYDYNTPDRPAGQCYPRVSRAYLAIWNPAIIIVHRGPARAGAQETGHDVNVIHPQNIDIRPTDVLIAQYLGRRQSFPPALVRSAEQAVLIAEELITPAAVYDEFPVQGIEGETLVLEVNESLAHVQVGHKIDLLHPAERVLVAVDTIGPALEKRVEELQSGGQPLDAYMLDSVGVVALGAVGEELRKVVQQRAADLGWGVSAALAPGSLVGWQLRGQRELCGMLPLEAIGVQLSTSYVLQPHKSASMLVGMGPGYESRHVGSVCRFCSLAGSCWRQRKTT